MNVIDKTYQINYPDTDIQENFTFSTVLEDGVFNFRFRWADGRWHVWVTPPGRQARPAGAEPNVMNWTGYADYGLMFVTDMTTIDFKSLYKTKLVLVKWV